MWRILLMEYARVELLLVRGSWSRGVRVAGTVQGPVRAAFVLPDDRTIAYCALPHKLARQLLARGQAANEPGWDALAREHGMITARTHMRGPQGTLGTISRVWVARPTGQITHLLVRERTRRLRAATERVVPVEVVESLRRGEVRVKIGADAFAELPVYRPDAAIESDVRLALESVLADPRARRGIKLLVDDGHVTLSGEVDTTDQLRYASRAAAAVAGVRALSLDLIAQETLAAAVEARIASLGALAGNGHAHIQVLAEHGIVHLEGTVPSPQAREAVERAVLSVSGAKVVVNGLRVGGEPPERATGTGPLVRNR
jgi:osmotically-inducible protein OsmY